MKVIDLIIKQYNNEDMPKHIKINRLNYIYNNNRKTYESEYGEFMSFDFINNVLNMQVEIIEEQQDIDIQAIEEFEIAGCNIKFNNTYISTESIINDMILDKTNKLVQAVKQLDRKIREER